MYWGDMKLTLLIATCNRADMLAETLSALCQVDRDDLSVEMVVIDNNSTDHTQEVVGRFSERLPVRYLFAERPGKNCALNKGLQEVELGDIIVFTDDDVMPPADWLKEIVATAGRFPDICVFGGGIYPVWPQGEVPAWIENSTLIKRFGFTDYQYRDDEGLYKVGDCPAGANLWVRREIFTGGRLFDESVGPNPTRRIMGSETSFLKQLTQEGYRFVFSPQVRMGHRIQPEQLSEGYVCQRAVWCGRQGPHIKGLCRRDLLAKNPALWRLLRWAGLAKAWLKYICARISVSPVKRLERSILSLIDISYNQESLRIAREINRQS